MASEKIPIPLTNQLHLCLALNTGRYQVNYNGEFNDVIRQI